MVEPIDIISNVNTDVIGVLGVPTSDALCANERDYTVSNGNRILQKIEFRNQSQRDEPMPTGFFSCKPKDRPTVIFLSAEHHRPVTGFVLTSAKEVM